MEGLNQVVASMMASGQRMMEQGQATGDDNQMAKAMQAMNFVQQIQAKQNKQIANEIILTDLSARNARVAQNIKGGLHGSALVELASMQESYSPSNMRGSKQLQSFFTDLPHAGQLMQTAERYVQGAVPLEIDANGRMITVTGSDLLTKARSDFAIAKFIYDNNTEEQDKGAFAKLVGLQDDNGRLLNRRETAIFNAKEKGFEEAVMATERIRAHIEERYYDRPPEEKERMVQLAVEQNLGPLPAQNRVREEVTFNGGKIGNTDQINNFLRIEAMTRSDLMPASGIPMELYKAALFEDAGVDTYKGANLKLKQTEMDSKIDQGVLSGQLGPFDLFMIQETRKFRDGGRGAFTPESLEMEFANNLPADQRNRALSAIKARDRAKDLRTAALLGNKVPTLEAKSVFEATAAVATGDRLTVMDSSTKLSPEVAGSRKSGMEYWLKKKDADEYYSGALQSHGGLRPYTRFMGSMANMFHPKTPSPRNTTELMLLTGGNPLSVLVSGSRGAFEELQNKRARLYSDPEFKRGYQYLEYSDQLKRGLLEGESKQTAMDFVSSFNGELVGVPGANTFEKQLKDAEVLSNAFSDEFEPIFGSTMRQGSTPQQNIYSRYGVDTSKASGAQLQAVARMESGGAGGSDLVRVQDPKTGKEGTFPRNQVPAGAVIIQ